ncbi:DUF4097 domain-containing protein [Streptomyces sp. NPDC048603]|uniref:DUF4097 family beta strand repeat-containing protein n=1 Tax=Streptomyces sp. NPDC048603 TaxID=3365577 RepID=UPI00371579B4
MPIFVTPQPIRATVELDVGNVWIIASDRTDTVVDVRPCDHRDPRDVVTSDQTRIDYAAGELVVSVPKARDLSRAGGAVAIVIHLPSGSGLHGDAVSGEFRVDGRLGECRLANDCGHIRLARTGTLHLTSGLGNVTVDRVAGDARISADCGDVNVNGVEGAAVVTRTKGDTRIGEVLGDVRVVVDSGDIHLGVAHAGVEAKTGQGDIRVEEIVQGRQVLESESGRLELGIAEGTEAQLDLDARSGTVYRSLDLLAAPFGTSAYVAKIHARTAIGDIVVHRSSVPDAGDGSGGVSDGVSDGTYDDGWG